MNWSQWSLFERGSCCDPLAEKARRGGTPYTKGPWVCQHLGCVFHQKRKRKGVFFSSKCKRKGVFLSRKCITRRQFSKMFRTKRHFSVILFIKGYILADFAKKTAYLSPKNCTRKAVLLEKIAIERVWFLQVPPPPPKRKGRHWNVKCNVNQISLTTRKKVLIGPALGPALGPELRWSLYMTSFSAVSSC